MTEQIAINVMEKYTDITLSKVVIEAHNMAIEALEKQIPYKPQEYEDKYYACKCGNALLMKWEKYPTKLMPKSRGLICCLACSQKLDWSE